MPKKRKHKLCYHKSTGQWYVRISGKMNYLGSDEIEAEERRREMLADWLCREANPDCFRLTVDDLCLLYMKHASQHYQKNGKPTSEVQNTKTALRPLIRLFGRLRARDFGPKRLKEVRLAMIDAGCVRTSINRQVGRIRQMFKWAVTEELLPVDVYQALSTVSGLRAGRSQAKESDPIHPVSESSISVVKPHVSRQVWAMIQLQLLTGMRPGEVVTLRGCDLNLGGHIWEYIPESHKTEHHEKKRIIFIGPKAQMIMREFLKADFSAHLFSPADARDEFDTNRRESRKTPMTPSQRARKKNPNPRKSPGDCYTVCSYGQAIRKGCEKAFGMPEDIRSPRRTVTRMQGVTDTERDREKSLLSKLASAWRRENCWHPHQLRHNAGTVIRRETDIETARAVLGHSSVVTTEIYAEMDATKARDIIGRIG